LLGIVLRLIVLSWTDPVAFDSAIYFEMARFIRAGAWEKALAYDYPPLFPFLIASLEKLGVPTEPAGLLLACGFNLAIIFPLFLITRELAGRRAALAAAFLWAAHPYAVRLSVRALSDSLTACFVAVSIWMGVDALKRKKLLMALSAGMLSGFAYLTRPEGIEAALGLAALYALRTEPPAYFSGRTDRISKRLLPATIPLLGWVLVASPYIASISLQAGMLTLSKKKSVQSMVAAVAPLPGASEKLLPPAIEESPRTKTETSDFPKSIEPRVSGELSRLARAGWNVYIFQRPLVNGLYPVIIFFAIWGICRFRSGKSPDQSTVFTLLCALSGLHFFVIVGVASVAGASYLGGHHFFLLAVYLMPFAGAGFTAAVAQVKTRFANFSWAPAATIVVIAATIIPAPLTWHERRGDSLRLAGLWVRQRLPDGGRVASRDAKFAFHAGAQRLDLDGNYRAAIDQARKQGASFVGLSGTDNDKNELQPLIRSGELELAAQFSETSGRQHYTYQVYRILPPHPQDQVS
jgi:4-amino-4-deoxy-L-arabinose transferase-like glycosyltransferase